MAKARQNMWKRLRSMHEAKCERDLVRLFLRMDPKKRERLRINQFGEVYR